jgi:hypothetical protein
MLSQIVSIFLSRRNKLEERAICSSAFRELMVNNSELSVTCVYVLQALTELSPNIVQVDSTEVYSPL